MQKELYPNPQSTFNQSVPDLHNIFSGKQIVQSYTHKVNHQIFIDPRQKRHHNSYHSSQMLIEHQPVEQYHRRSKGFVEDDLLGELQNGNIVENFMIDEKQQPYQTCENVFKGRGEKQSYKNENMLASSSQNNDVPSRNSSLSSLSDKNHFINIKANRYFLHDDMVENRHTKAPKNHVKTIKKSHHVNNHYRANSENEMDLQNSPYDQDSPYHINQNYITQPGHQFYFTPKPNAVIELAKNNAFVQPQNITALPTFRRLDIDQERQRREKMLKIQKIQQAGCNCKKSKCLKMYCECFNLQIFCNQNCNCVSCCNQQSNQDHRKAVLDALTRNPKAFHEVTQKLQATFELGVQLTQVKKGCKCKKTKCQKKYCQCFNIGEKCGKFCKCQGCENC